MSSDPSQPASAEPQSVTPPPVQPQKPDRQGPPPGRAQAGGLSGFAAQALKRAKAVSAAGAVGAAPPPPKSEPAASGAPAVAEAATAVPPPADLSAGPAEAPPAAPSAGRPEERRPRGDRPQRREGKGPRGRRDKEDSEGAEERQSRQEFKPPPPVPIPNLRGPMPDDLQAELDAALGGLSIEEIVGGKSAPLPEAGRLPNESRHRAQVVDVHGDNVFFALGGKNQGVCSARNFGDKPPQPGAMIDVVVTGYNSEDNLHEVTVPGGAIVAGDWGDLAEGSLVEARVTGANTGGLECQVNNIRGFIPASQVSDYRVENLGELVGQKFVCVVTEANQGRGNLVLSRRAVLEREKEETKKKTLAELQVGELREGIVRRIQDFGAFVDIGGVDGLIHVSQMSWERVKHPSEVVQEGQKVRVRVEKIDPETGKIGLSLKNPEEHPWKDIQSRFPVGSTVRGPVTRLAQFGAFVKVAPGVEGLIHVSELAHHKVYKVENVVKEGDEVEAKVLSVDPEAQRMSLSLKATLERPVKASDKPKGEAEAPDEPPRAPTVPKRPGPLKGGIGKSTGGDQFGLRW